MNPDHPSLRVSLRALFLLLAAVLAVFPSFAQVAPAPSPAAKPTSEETVTLSPFIVSTEVETGWSANETLSATRTKQMLKDVPVNIDAITADFMEDLGLNTADEVANFIANAYAPPTLENDNQSGAIAFRGLTGSTATRNYFRWYIPSDTYNVERIDFGKGSNSLIFGDVEPGGQAAVFTKRALMRNFGTVSAQYNSDGAYRFMLDYNRKLREGLAMRFNAVRRQERTFQDASTFTLEGETLTATWQPLKTTLIRVDYERGDFANVRGFGGVTIREQSGRSRSYTTDRLYYTSDGEWFQRSSLPTADRSNGPAGGSPSLLEGEYFDVTMRNAAGAIVGTKRFNGYPKHYNLRGSFDRQNRPFDTYSVTVEQRLGPIGLEVAYNHQKQTAIRNDNFFSSTISVDVNGRPYVETELDEKRFGNYVDAFRGTAVYKFDRWKWMQQLFVGSAEYREDTVLNYRFNTFNIRNVERGTATALNTNTDRVRLRLFLDDPRFYSRALFDSMKPANLPDTNDVKARSLAFFPSGTSATDGTQWRQASAVSLSASGSYFRGRIQTLIGARHDWNRNYEYNGVRTFGNYGEEIAPPKKADALPGEYVENKQLHLENTSLTGGVTIRLTKDLNFYGVYSESFRFQGLRTFDRERFPPITGVTKEIGLKGNLWNDRISVNLGAFNIDRQNVALSWNGVTGIDFTTAEIEDLMNPNNLRPGDPGYKYGEEGTASNARYYRSTENSQGADLTLGVKPTKGLQMRFTLARTKVLGQPDLGSFRGYYEAAVARGDESPALLNEAKNLLNSLDIDTKPTGARASPWSASWVIDYAFSRESWKPLRGVRVGVNGSWRDDYLFGISNGQELAGGTTHLVNGYVMRDQKIWNQQTRFRVGFRNIFDLENSKVRKIGFTTMVSGANVYRYSYVVPLQVDANVTVRF
ncbi:TonB-dependent siderophore receptor [Horticoccus sp. 23ND18S-11]|uniref:TonB-dependent siderophore receptor n=1 Tax=Horticoccus sp. 23ND18S-11 TaxID=3391832 RepID=UPI0039C9BC73